MKKRILRRISFGIFFYFFLSFSATCSLPHVENFIVSIGIPPYWDGELMAQYRWNKIIIETGKPPKNWRE
jgi:hypothetical protein